MCFTFFNLSHNQILPPPLSLIWAKFFLIGTRSIKHSDTDFPLHLLMIILFLTLIILSLFTYCLKICENMFCRHSGPDSGESSSEGGDNHCMRWKFAVSLHCCCCQWKVGRQLRIMPYNDTTSMYTSSSIYDDGYYHHHQPPPPSYVDIFPDSGPPGI